MNNLKWITELLKLAQKQIIPGSFDFDAYVKAKNIILTESDSYSDRQQIGEYLAGMCWSASSFNLSRRLLVVQPILQGLVGRVRVPCNESVVQIANDLNVEEKEPTNKYIYPPEFYLSGFEVYTKEEMKNNNLALGILLNTLCKEDIHLCALLHEVSKQHEICCYTDKVTLRVLNSMSNDLYNEGGTNAFVVEQHAWEDLTQDKAFCDKFEPSEPRGVVQGILGHINEIPILTDAHLNKELQTLSVGDVYAVVAPFALGAITQRKELDIRYVEITDEKILKELQKDDIAYSWFFEQIQGMVLFGKGVIRATKK